MQSIEDVLDDFVAGNAKLQNLELKDTALVSIQSFSCIFCFYTVFCYKTPQIS